MSAGAPDLDLHDGEAVVMDVIPAVKWTWGQILLSLGLFEIWRKRHHYVLTNQRVIHTYGVFSTVEESVQLARIQDAVIKRSPVSGGTIVLSTAGNTGPFSRIQMISNAEALTFHRELVKRLQK